MMWAIGYIVCGLFVARSVRIYSVRRSVGIIAKQEECSLCWRDYVCSRHSSPYTHPNLLAWVSFLFWPIVGVMAAIFGLIFMFWALGPKIGHGIGRGAKMVALSPPVHTIGKVNRWFWQDPKERKKDRVA